jgi:hypothetical protein
VLKINKIDLNDDIILVGGFHIYNVKIAFDIIASTRTGEESDNGVSICEETI